MRHERNRPQLVCEKSGCTARMRRADGSSCWRQVSVGRAVWPRHNATPNVWRLRRKDAQTTAASAYAGAPRAVLRAAQTVNGLIEQLWSDEHWARGRTIGFGGGWECVQIRYGIIDSYVPAEQLSWWCCWISVRVELTTHNAPGLGVKERERERHGAENFVFVDDNSPTIIRICLMIACY